MTEALHRPVFLDTAYAIALVNSDDLLHAVAVDLAHRLEADRASIVTSRAILLEIGNGLSKPLYRQTGAELLEAISQDPAIEVVELTAALYFEALVLYRERRDKGWGMTDCTSFVIMQASGIEEALPHDVHFEQAGFRALMRGPA